MYAEMIEATGVFAGLMFLWMVVRPAVQSVLGEAWAARNFSYTVHEPYRLSQDGSGGGRIRMPLVARMLARAEKAGRHARGGRLLRKIRVEPLDYRVRETRKLLLAWPSFRIRPVTQTAIMAGAVGYMASLAAAAASSGQLRPLPPVPPRPEFAPGNFQYDDLPETITIEPSPAPAPAPVLIIDEPSPVPAPERPRGSLFAGASDDWNMLLAAARA